MKKESGFYADSLEMLLDTMCNMLGAVVFIALMVAMLTRDSTAPQPADNPAQAAQLSNELAALTASNSMAEAELQKTLLRLQDSHLHAATNLMRLPNISNTSKQPWTVIVRYGKLYPLDVLSTDGRGVASRNNRNLERQQKYVERRLVEDVEPRAGLGAEPEQGVTDMAQAFKASGASGYYFVFWVYADSFEAFMRARDTATRLGFQYGWKPLPLDEGLRLSTQGGEHVLPQN
jgi:hypothetical protein